MRRSRSRAFQYRRPESASGARPASDTQGSPSRCRCQPLDQTNCYLIESPTMPIPWSMRSEYTAVSVSTTAAAPTTSLRSIDRRSVLVVCEVMIHPLSDSRASLLSVRSVSPHSADPRLDEASPAPERKSIDGIGHNLLRLTYRDPFATGPEEPRTRPGRPLLLLGLRRLLLPLPGRRLSAWPSRSGG